MIAGAAIKGEIIFKIICFILFILFQALFELTNFMHENRIHLGLNNFIWYVCGSALFIKSGLL